MSELVFKPFRVAIPDADVADLQRRLTDTRWPAQLPGQPWVKGVPVDYLQGLAKYWADEFDWRAAEERINAFPQFTTEIDGQTIHFLHIESAAPDAVPLILLHGWPGSFVEFLNVIEPLSQQFHLVIPSLPGFGFSIPLAGEGWSHPKKVAQALTKLMVGLGYDRYGVQGGDYGAFVGPDMGRVAPEHVIGVHLNAATIGFMPLGPVEDAELATMTESEQARVARMANWNQEMSAYFQLQATRPQTLSFAITDSPAGQLAWIVEKFSEWTNTGKGVLPEAKVDRDHMLTDVSIYWFTGTGTTSANMYYESMHSQEWPTPSEVPTGVAVFAEDVSIRRYAEQGNNIVHWSEFDTGGHFAAMETPDLLVADIRKFFAAV